MKLPAFLMMLATCPAALATGESVQVEKLNFERHLLGRYSMHLEVVGDGSFRGCRRLTVSGTYSFWRWKVRHRSVTSPSWSGHALALRGLAANSEPFWFETAGEGLRESSTACRFFSEGLSGHYWPTGVFGVLSFYRNS